MTAHTGVGCPPKQRPEDILAKADAAWTGLHDASVTFKAEGCNSPTPNNRLDLGPGDEYLETHTPTFAMGYDGDCLWGGSGGVNYYRIRRFRGASGWRGPLDFHVKAALRFFSEAPNAASVTQSRGRVRLVRSVDGIRHELVIDAEDYLPVSCEAGTAATGSWGFGIFRVCGVDKDQRFAADHFGPPSAYDLAHPVDFPSPSGDNVGPTPQTTASNLPLRGYKGQTYEGGVRVPFMLQWKGRLPAGEVSRQPVIALDIHPTAVWAAGESVDPTWALDGVNLLPFLSGEDPGAPHEALYWRMHQQRAMRQGEWKLVMGNQSAAWELYNLEDDIAEQHDLAGEMPEKTRELTAMWEDWNSELMDPLWVRQDSRTEGGGAGNRSERDIEQRFRQLDRDGDGKLSPDELPRAQLFERLDANGDGFVDREEARPAPR